MSDAVNHPIHYNSHPSGVEAIDICEMTSFNIGNAIKYVMRADHKNSKLQDLEKALWYIKREMMNKTILDFSNNTSNIDKRIFGYALDRIIEHTIDDNLVLFFKNIKILVITGNRYVIEDIKSSLELYIKDFHLIG